MPLHTTICACASAPGGRLALLRLSGPDTRAVCAAAGLALPVPWCWHETRCDLPQGSCPVRLLYAPAGRSFTGEDLVECVLPGSPVLITALLDRLCAAGAQPAGRGAFTRMALATGPLSLDQAEALLGLVHAADAAAAGRALERLQGALGREFEPCRERLLDLLAQVEAGLDFMEEEDVSTYDAAALRAELAAVQTICRGWRRAARDHGQEPVVCLVGPANAGKSALFTALCGEPALVSPRPGTTRDWLRGRWRLGGRELRLLDTAGWMTAVALEAMAVDAGRALIDGADLVIACSSPDAPLPRDHRLPEERTLLLATKADLGAPDSRCELACSAETGAGLDALAAAVDRRLGEGAIGEERQQRLLAVADRSCADLLRDALPEDVLLAEELRGIADALGELIGACTDEEVLDRIFGRFCIGK